MGMVFRNGLMAPNMKDSGRMMKHMETDLSTKSMVIFVRARGKTIWCMDSGNIETDIEIYMKGTGSLIYLID